jgi:hydroxymethylbilane synthase
VTLATLPLRAAVATSSTRRTAQLRHLRRDLEPIAVRGNVGTRLDKLLSDPSIDALLLAHAGLNRLGFFVGPTARLCLDPRLPFHHGLTAPPPGILATLLDVEHLLPAVGQGALALETRTDSRPLVGEVMAALNHQNTRQATLAERSFLQAMGGGCQSPLGAYARIVGHQLWLRAASYQPDAARFAEGRLPIGRARELGEFVAAQLN